MRTRIFALVAAMVLAAGACATRRLPAVRRVPTTEAALPVALAYPAREDAEVTPARNCVRWESVWSTDPLDGATRGLKTSITRWSHPERKSQITLIAAVHVGDPGYYDSIRTLLHRYDRVLVEGLRESPDGPAVDPKDKKAFLETIAVAKLIAEGLDLVLQRDRLEHGELWRLADADLGTFCAELRRRGAQFPSESADFQKGVELLTELFEDARSDDPSLERQEIWARIGRILAARSDEDAFDEVAITFRNQFVWNALEEELAAVPPPRSIGLVYGGAHMEDLHMRLVGAGWRCRDLHWIPAWGLVRRDP
ncbi:MAG: hypothetical protein JNJ88_08380 [Planctomycetes bacterium]|nr:hypothetical protein [Planctomycetota bacterium]